MIKSNQNTSKNGMSSRFACGKNEFRGKCVLVWNMFEIHMEHTLLTGLSPIRVPTSSFLFFCCLLYLVFFALTLKSLLFLVSPSRLSNDLPFFNMIFGIDTGINEWLSHGMPLPALGGEGKLESRPTVTRLSLGCLILVRSLI